MVRFVALSFAGAIVGCRAGQTALEQFIANWVPQWLGTRYGSGQCTALANGAEEAARAAGFDVPQMNTKCHNNPRIYCWSDNEISLEEAQPGDILQFHMWDEKSKDAHHHTAIVREVYDGSVLKVWEQNQFGADKNGNACEGVYHPNKGTGEIHVFRMGGDAPSPSPGPSWYRTITPSYDTNLCLDTPGDSNADATPLWLWECNGEESQRWVFDNWQIRFGADESKCIDAGDMSDGTQLFLWDCNGFPQQTWAFDADAARVYLSNTAMCLDFYSDEEWSGQPLHIWSCNGDWNQQWGIWDVGSDVLDSEALV